MRPGARLVGLDVARALALLGMVATHLLPEIGPDGQQTWATDLAGGRASALFAVLAGITMALLTGGRTPLRGRDRWRASLGVALRAVLVGVVGLWLGGLDTGLAVILTYYAVLFLLGLPFTGLRVRSLAVLAVVWLVAVPLASQWVRPRLPGPSYDNPSWAGLGDPVQLGSELLLTGYYPALPWLAYLLAGTAVGRSDLGRRGVQAGWLVGGLVLATVAGVGSRVLAGRELGPRLLEEASLGLPGTTPTDRWSYLLLDAPHSGTPFDLAATTGSALAVIGGSLLLIGVLPGLGVRFMAVVFGAGTMTLTLYTLHAVLRTDTYWPPAEGAFQRHVLLLAAIGAVFVALHWRGPLELLVGLPGRLLRRNRSTAPYVASA